MCPSLSHLPYFCFSFGSFSTGQLNLYGFNRLTAGTDKGAYYHEFFIRGQRSLCRGMVRQKIKGTKVRRTLSPEEEPNFYVMSNVSSTTPPPLQLDSEEESSSPPVHHHHQEELSGKDLALQLRRERLETVRGVLEQTEQLCDDQSVEDDFDRRARAISSSVPSVSPAESEESDSEESHHHVHNSNSSSRNHTFMMMGAPQQQTPPPPPQQILPAMDGAPLEPREDRFTQTMTTADEYMMKGGDLLFFEGKPFHYLEHLDAVPQVPISGQPPNKQNGFYQRDTLHSLMRVDPKSIMGSAY